MAKHSSRLLGVLGAAVILSSVSAYSSDGCSEYRIGDGFCQQQNNNAECGYDGGDCCECTCVSSSDDYYDLGCTIGSSFACIDPDAPCVDDDDITVDMVENCDVSELGDGWCDQENNKEICGYDGGDCCECTCVDAWSDEGCEHSYFACIDPAAPCVDDDGITADMMENCGYTIGYGNGFCDEENNNEACGYDGGDCCECTCGRPPEDDTLDDDWSHEDWNGPCGRGFACIDPNAACVDDDEVTVGIIEICNSVWMGDGICHMDNNNEACAYDGGDCCECTCKDTPNDKCGSWNGFACIDPEAPCVDDDFFTVDMIENCRSPSALGDGWCDEDQNNELCAYDGGDCCECTCEAPSDGFFWACDDLFACIDPNAPCVDDDSVTVDMLENCDLAPQIGDGYCDDDLNTPECAYDGGDCCSCTCQNDDGCWTFACIDPEAACVDDDAITADMFENCEYPSDVGDARCDEGNNNEACGYDGGDCCSCTCQSRWDDDNSCSSEYNSFDCKDPSASCFGAGTTGSDDFSFDDDDEPMSYEFAPWEETESLPTVTDAVEVGTKTEVGVSATAHDVRPGSSGGDVGCGEVGGLGCTANNTRDGIFSEIESRWSCATKLVPDEGPCRIEFSFAEPQNIVDIQVAFWKGNERTRTLDVHVNGELTHTHKSYTDHIFNTLGVTATEASTVMLESVALLSNEWISLVEVLIFVTP